MNAFRAVLRFLAGLFETGADLPPEVRAYCRQEGVDPQALLRDLKPSEPVVLPESPKLFLRDGLSGFPVR